ncbi:MAG TPA: polyprenyl synthetase family protein [Verrucomicrobiae bacterium]
MLVTARNTTTDASPNQAAPSWKEIAGGVQPFLEKVSAGLSAQVEAFHPQIAKYARYALTNQGKQLRPTLVALSGSAVGPVNDSLVKVAVIIEMVHLATLVHDDIMDEAELRRCRPTLAANWGNELSVLVGDCLFAHSVTLAASFPTPDVCRAVAKATNTVCSGEILQTNQRHDYTLTRADYIKSLEMKTGELFALSCELGASLVGGTPAESAALRSYGMALGTAYQIYDDCLDLFGTEEIVGKSLGTDLYTGKLTLPVLIVLEKGTNSDRVMLQNCIEAPEPENLEKIFELLERFDALSDTRRVVNQYIKQAQQVLGELEQQKGARGIAALSALGDYLAQQTRALGVR